MEKLKGGDNSIKRVETNTVKRGELKRGEMNNVSGKGGKREVKCNEHNRDTYCKCEENTDNDDMMVGCDCCENWFHPSCIKKKGK